MFTPMLIQLLSSSLCRLHLCSPGPPYHQWVCLPGFPGPPPLWGWKAVFLLHPLSSMREASGRSLPHPFSLSWILVGCSRPGGFRHIYVLPPGFPGGSAAKNLPTMQDSWIQSLGQKYPLEKEMATHSSVLCWRIPRTEEPGGLQSMGWQRVGHDWRTEKRRYPTIFWPPYGLILILLKPCP